MGLELWILNNHGIVTVGTPNKHGIESTGILNNRGIKQKFQKKTRIGTINMELGLYGFKTMMEL